MAESKSDSTRGREDSKQFGCPESFIEKTRIQSAALIIMKPKKRISKTESIKQILVLLRKGYATEVILEEISSNWVLPETTFYNHFKEAKAMYQSELQRQQKAIEEVREQEVKKVAQKGLKSKLERDLELQSDIEYYQDVLSGKIKTTFILGQKVSATESLPIQIVLLIQKTINDLRIELSKRLGEYATTQVELTNKNFIPDEVVITIIDGKRVN